MTNTQLKKAAAAYPDYAMPPFDALLAARDGFEALMVLTEAYGGDALYIPSLRSILKDCVIQEAISGQTTRSGRARALRKVGYSRRHAQKLAEDFTEKQGAAA